MTPEEAKILNNYMDGVEKNMQALIEGFRVIGELAASERNADSLMTLKEHFDFMREIVSDLTEE